MADKAPWQDRSEIVTGLVLNEHLDANLVDPGSLVAPYDDIMKMLRKKGTTIEDVVAAHGFSYVKAAQMAAAAVNGDKEKSKKKPVDWVNLLEQAASFYRYGEELSKMADALMSGKPIDSGLLLQFASGLDLGYRTLTPLDKVEPEEAQWILTGYHPIDEFFGGLPKAGLTLLVGPPGLGKTTLALKIAMSMVRYYDGKQKKEAPGKVALFSLEMLLSQVVARLHNLDPKIKKSELARILGSESAYKVGEIYAVAARAAANEENLKLIVIDFADMLAEGEQTEAIMGVIYRSLAMLAKTTGVPVLLVAGVNRNVYESGIPKINHIRYSSMAEYMAAMILLLYNPSATISDGQSSKILPFASDRGYIIGGKSRFGFKMGRPGAVQVEFFGETGWGEQGFSYFDVHV